MKKVISLAAACALAASMCLGVFAEGVSLSRSVTEEGEATYLTQDGQVMTGEMQITVTRNPAEELDADMIAQIESAAGQGAVCREVLQVFSTADVKKGTAGIPSETAEEAAETSETEQNELKAVVEETEAPEDEAESEAEPEAEAVAMAEESDTEDVIVLHALVLQTDLQEPDDVTTTVWFYDVTNDVWATSESMYEYDHKEGTLQLVLPVGYTKAAIVTVQHTGLVGYLRTFQNQLLKMME